MRRLFHKRGFRKRTSEIKIKTNKYMRTKNVKFITMFLVFYSGRAIHDMAVF